MMKLHKNNLNTIAITMVLSTIYSAGTMFASATPYAVTRFKELPNYYLQLRPQNSVSGPSTLKIKEKNRICKDVFEIIEETDPLDPSAHQNMLKSEHPEIFNELFEERCARRYGLIRAKECDEKSKIHHYVNAAKPIRLLIDGGEYVENVFTCLFVTDENILRRYYVSDYTYNVNDSPRSSAIPGRFVFYDGEVYALAERLPRVLKSRNTDPGTQVTLAEYYWSRRTAYGREKTTISNEKTDPICGLDNGRKLRLCTYAHLSDSIVTPPQWRRNSISVRQERCEKLTVSFTDGNQFEEWMIVCDYHESPESHRSVHVSRGYKDNAVLVSVVDAKQKVDFIYLLDRVSVAVDYKTMRSNN